MTTVVAKADSAPQFDANKVHVDLYTVKHQREQVAPTKVNIVAGLYGYDQYGVKRFSENRNMQTNFQDAGSQVIGAYCQANQVTPASAEQLLETAKDYWQEQFLGGQLSDLDLIALQDLIISRLLEIDGKLTIAGLD